MRIWQWMALSLLVLGFVSVEAKPAFQITMITPIVNVSPGGSGVAVYQVTNTSGITMPQMRYYPTVMTTMANSSTCIDGQTLANNATCELDLTLTLPSNIPVGTVLTLGDVGACGFNGRICSINNPANRVTVVVPSFLVGMGAGESLTGGQVPLVGVSTDGTLSSWAIKPISGNPALGQYVSGACTGSGQNTICAAAGTNLVTNRPIIAVSTNAGATWINAPIVGNPAAGAFSSVSCTGSGVTAICAAVGSDDDSGAALIVVSTDGGTTWTNTPIAGNPAGLYSGVSCTGSGATAICAAGGSDFTAAPIIAVSTNGGITWTSKPIAGAPGSGTYNSVGCTGSGSTAVCAAAGLEFNTFGGILAVSTDGGNTWTNKSIAGPGPVPGDAASCTGSGSAAICVASGSDFLTGIVAVSTDGGNTWTRKVITGNPAAGDYLSADCVGSGSTALCVAAGVANGVVQSGSIAVSTDGGNTWTHKTFTGDPGKGVLSTVSCTGDSGPAAMCVIVGQNGVTNQPMVVVSTNGGHTWATKPITGNPTTGAFYGSGTGSVSFKAKRRSGI